MTRLVAGRIRFDFEGLDGEVASWIQTVFGPLHASPQTPAKLTVTLRFVDDLQVERGPLWPLPIAPIDDGLAFVDHLGRAATMTFPVTEREVLVDRNIDPWFFQRWVYFPLLKACLWQERLSLIHAAGVSIDGHRIAITGWAGAGKSPVMLRLLEAGAEFLGDDWLAMSEDGIVHPISAQLNLNAWHRHHVDAARWPGTEPRLLPAVKRGAELAARAAGRYRKVSLGFNRIADLASAAGKIKVSLSEVFPETRVAAPGPLEALFFVPRKGLNNTGLCEANLAERVASTSRSELLYIDDLESAIRFAHPGVLSNPLLGSAWEEAEVIASGLFHSHKEIVDHGGSTAGVKRVAAHIIDVTRELRARSAVA